MDNVCLVLTDTAMEQLLRFTSIALVRTDNVQLRLSPRDITVHEKANMRMRGALIARLRMKLQVAQISRMAPYKVRIPTEQALALVAEWTGPISDSERALLSVGEVVGDIDRTFA